MTPNDYRLWHITLRAVGFGEEPSAMVALSPIQNADEPSVATEAAS
ncbi:MAG: hypothetical protein AAGG48_32005 [Planctomycetota bacterium]